MTCPTCQTTLYAVQGGALCPNTACLLFWPTTADTRPRPSYRQAQAEAEAEEETS